VNSRLEKELPLFLAQFLIPTDLWEGLGETLQRSYEAGLPLRPKVIFTSNAFFYDDEFKVHTAASISDCVYMVGQHGNNHGVSRIAEILPEFNTSDYFLTWGWTSSDSKTHPFGQIKPRVRAGIPKRIKGVTLFLRDESLHLLDIDMHGPNDRYFDQVVSLCQKLDSLQIQTTIKVHPSTPVFRIEALRRAFEFLSKVKFSKNLESIPTLLRAGEGIVFTYDSTGMLEMGTARIPFFCFAPDGLELVRSDYVANYKNLREAGLLSEEASEAANLIVKWINASSQAKKLQLEGVRNFVEGIAFYPKFKTLKLASLLKRARARNLQISKTLGLP
jgi:putative transferase (TIGR04331 family)